jgi:hypothetical protein
MEFHIYIENLLILLAHNKEFLDKLQRKKFCLNFDISKIVRYSLRSRFVFPNPMRKHVKNY